jgi:hypothetical protein
MKIVLKEYNIFNKPNETGQHGVSKVILERSKRKNIEKDT